MLLISDELMANRNDSVKIEWPVNVKFLIIHSLPKKGLSEKTIEMGKMAVEWRANITVKAIHKAVTRK